MGATVNLMSERLQGQSLIEMCLNHLQSLTQIQIAGLCPRVSGTLHNSRSQQVF